jgi:hypothetical protein
MKEIGVGAKDGKGRKPWLGPEVVPEAGSVESLLIGHSDLVSACTRWEGSAGAGASELGSLGTASLSLSIWVMQSAFGWASEDC